MSKFKPKKIELKKTKQSQPKTANLNIRMDPEVKRTFDLHCESLGITVTEAVTQLMKAQTTLKTA